MLKFGLKFKKHIRFYSDKPIGQQLYERSKELGLNNCETEEELINNLKKIFPDSVWSMSLPEMIDDMELNVLPQMKRLGSKLKLNKNNN